MSELHNASTETLIPLPDLHGLTVDPDQPIPMWVGGKPTKTVSVPEAYVRRLTTWAAMSGYDLATTVVIDTYCGRAVGGPNRLMGLFDPRRSLVADLVLPAITTKITTFGGGPETILGWSLKLTPPGREPVDVDLLDGGVVSLRGTAEQQKAAWEAHAGQKARQAAELRRQDGLGPLDDVARATRQRTAVGKEHDVAEVKWREAIRAAVAARESGSGRFTIEDIARNAGISQGQVHQI